MVSPEPVPPRPSDKAPHRSSLLGQRKKRAPRAEKPQALGDFSAAPLPPAAESVAPPSGGNEAKTGARTPASRFRRRTEQRLEALSAQVTALSSLIHGQAQATPAAALERQLQSGREELEELSAMVADLEGQLEQARHRVEELERAAEEDTLVRGQLEKLVHSARHRLEAEQKLRLGSQQQLNDAESLLREALLALLSPGDEFQEQLVDELQKFLDL